MSTVISGPIPLYSNPPIEPQYYKPSRFEITDVTLGITTIVTTAEDVNFSVGSVVRLLIPPLFGCRELNMRQGNVLSFPTSTSVEVDINSSQNVNPYIAYAGNTTPPQIVAIGDVNNGAVNAVPSVEQTFIDGSFLNISPN